MVKLGPKKVLNGSRLTEGRGSSYLGNAQIDRALFKKEPLRVRPLFVISMTILRCYNQSGKQAISLASTSALSVSLAYWMRISIVDKGFIVHVIQALLCLELELAKKNWKANLVTERKLWGRPPPTVSTIGAAKSNLAHLLSNELLIFSAVVVEEEMEKKPWSPSSWGLAKSAPLHWADL